MTATAEYILHDADTKRVEGNQGGVRGEQGGLRGVEEYATTLTLAGLPPTSVMMGQSLGWLSLVVNDQQDTQDCCVGEVAHTLHGERQHHLRITHVLKPVEKHE